MGGKRIFTAVKKREFSQLMCMIGSVVLCLFGGWMIWKYYSLTELAITRDSSTTPDAALPISGITAIITPFVAYLIYQAKLKDSRNKYGISENGVPYAMPDQNGGE